MGHPLDYASPRGKPRGAGYYILVALNCITLLAGLFVAAMWGSAMSQHDGWGQLGVFVIGTPAAMAQLAIGTISIGVAGWRDPLNWLAGLSLSLNCGVWLLNLLGPHYGGC